MPGPPILADWRCLAASPRLIGVTPTLIPFRPFCPWRSVSGCLLGPPAEERVCTSDARIIADHRGPRCAALDLVRMVRSGRRPEPLLALMLTKSAPIIEASVRSPVTVVCGGLFSGEGILDGQHRLSSLSVRCLVRFMVAPPLPRLNPVSVSVAAQTTRRIARQLPEASGHATRAQHRAEHRHGAGC